MYVMELYVRDFKDIRYKRELFFCKIGFNLIVGGSYIMFFVVGYIS